MRPKHHQTDNIFNIPGFKYLPAYLDIDEQNQIIAAVADIIKMAPPYKPVMPGSGKPFSIEMTNCGDLGWVSDKSGYRYQSTHPLTQRKWPAIPEILQNIWHKLSDCHEPAEACLINLYQSDARMGLHQDNTEDDLLTSVISISIGSSAVFRMGGKQRASPTRSIRIHSGDIIIMGGESRLNYHGIDRIINQPGPEQSAGAQPSLPFITSPDLLAAPSASPTDTIPNTQKLGLKKGRLNLTLRRVNTIKN